MCPNCAQPNVTGRIRTSPNATPAFRNLWQIQDKIGFRSKCGRTQNPSTFGSWGFAPPPGTSAIVRTEITVLRGPTEELSLEPRLFDSILFEGCPQRLRTDLPDSCRNRIYRGSIDFANLHRAILIRALQIHYLRLLQHNPTQSIFRL
jgi:hypothetical protein